MRRTARRAPYRKRTATDRAQIERNRLVWNIELTGYRGGPLQLDPVSLVVVNAYSMHVVAARPHPPQKRRRIHATAYRSAFSMQHKMSQ